MNRRNFLLASMGAAAMAVVPKNDDGVALRSMKHPTLLHDAAHHDLTEGFGLATIKREGATIPFDQGAYVAEVGPRILKSAGVTMKKAEFSQEITDGFEKAFGDHYEKPEDWPETWNDE